VLEIVVAVAVAPTSGAREIFRVFRRFTRKRVVWRVMADCLGRRTALVHAVVEVDLDALLDTLEVRAGEDTHLGVLGVGRRLSGRVGEGVGEHVRPWELDAVLVNACFL
jgi:hypothetical protein